MFPDGWLTVNLQEGAIFSRSLNDNRRMIMTGLYFIRFSSQNVCFNSVYSKKKTQSWNRTVSSEPRLTDISVNRDSPRSYVCHPVLYKRRYTPGLSINWPHNGPSKQQHVEITNQAPNSCFAPTYSIQFSRASIQSTWISRPRNI